MTQSPRDSAPPRRWYHPVKLLQRMVIYPGVGYIVFCVILAYLQTALIYAGYTQSLTPAQATHDAKIAGLVPWDKTTPGASGPQGFVPPNFTAPAPRGTVVFFHGNGEAAWLWAEQVPAFTKRGFRVFMYEYPGYGGRPGVPSEKTIVPDARAVVRSLIDQGYGPIYLWGVSLGSGVAAAVAADKTLDIRGVVLVAPWDEIGNVGQSYYPFLPVKLLMTDKYNSIANLEHFGHPVCIIYGDKDDTIPPQLALNLFAKLPDPKKLMLEAGYGHANWDDGPDEKWWDEALDYIASKK